jgi:hypothetical protein
MHLADYHKTGLMKLTVKINEKYKKYTTIMFQDSIEK